MKVEFSKADELWHDAECYQSPSALQGWLTGHLAAGARPNRQQWLEEAYSYLELEDERPEPLSQFLNAMHDEVMSSLVSEDMHYQLLLPTDEDADVIEQVECLAQWSKGFLDGFGASGVKADQLGDDVFEVLRDLDAFSQASIDEPRDADNETIYAELAEHARISALTVFYSLNRQPPTSPALQ